jgi:hypothetical protein
MLTTSNPTELCAFVGAFGLTSAVTAVGVRDKGDDGVVANLPVPGPAGAAIRCIDDPAIAEVLDAPDAYYIQMASTDHPNGAVRGDDIVQLFGGSGGPEFAAAPATGIDVDRPFQRRE